MNNGCKLANDLAVLAVGDLRGIHLDETPEQYGQMVARYTLNFYAGRYVEELTTKRYPLNNRYYTLKRRLIMPKITSEKETNPAANQTPDPIDVEVGCAMRLRRRELHITQDELAKAIGITFQQVQKYEKAANRISASRLFKVAKALKVDVMYFFPELPTPDLDLDLDQAGHLACAKTNMMIALVHVEKAESATL
ncbi:MAG: helix-turn-helix transcriptional regulator [Kordiimonadaceae bacterium]|nr:helix-turn-helix transcriptional regulator [Kordiimonadaceae bacterium]